MIALGYDLASKQALIRASVEAHGITQVFCLSPTKFPLTCPDVPMETIDYTQIIEYRYFYRLLQEIGPQTLLVINECLRTQNRYDLTYNCIRHFLNQTSHQLIFQYLPQIDTIEDFMILFDFDTRSRWKRERFRAALLAEASIRVQPVPLQFTDVKVSVSDAIQARYAREKAKLFAGLGLKDPHTLPRNLYLLGGTAKKAAVEPDRWYLGRNTRLKLPNLQTYREPAYPHTYTVLEFCHNFLDFVDVLSLSRQTRWEVLVADLKVDHWYWGRYRDWAERLDASYTALQRP
jgi:hypothetical protein